MSRYILTTYNMTDTITVNGYYTLSNDNMNQVTDWFNNFTESYFISDIITLTNDNFNMVEVQYDVNVEKFIAKYGNPCNILEHIDDLSDIFDSAGRERLLSIETDDSDLYTGTEDVSRLINAHMKGDEDTVKMLLSEKEFDDSDDIVNKIISQH